MSVDAAPYLALVAAVALSAIVAYRLGYRHGKDIGWADGFFSHKKLYDETKLRLRNAGGQFSKPSLHEIQTNRPPSAPSSASREAGRANG